MADFNTSEFNQSEWNSGESNSSVTPPTAPVATISTPLASPPQQLTNYATLINGQYKEAGVMIYRNGLLLTEGLDYTRNSGVLTMLLILPQPGDLMVARVFAVGGQLGGAKPERYIAPWTVAIAGKFDGVATLYEIVFGPTIMGACDGRNNLFTWGITLQRALVFRNGILQTLNVDVVNGPTAMVFLPGAIPQPGDILTILGY